jgi:hypothetical protein
LAPKVILEDDQLSSKAIIRRSSQMQWNLKGVQGAIKMIIAFLRSSESP